MNKGLVIGIIVLVMAGVFIYFNTSDYGSFNKGGEDTGSNGQDDLQVIKLDLIFRYGVEAKNELNTFDGTFTKDMVVDPPITIKLSLTEDELNQIYGKMIEIDFFSYPNEFSISVPDGKSAFYLAPSSSYYYKVDFDSEIKELTWQDNIAYKDNIAYERGEKANMLKELNRLIIEIVEAKEEYKELPVPTGGYA